MRSPSFTAFPTEAFNSAANAIIEEADSLPLGSPISLKRSEAETEEAEEGDEEEEEGRDCSRSSGDKLG